MGRRGRGSGRPPPSGASLGQAVNVKRWVWTWAAKGLGCWATVLGFWSVGRSLLVRIGSMDRGSTGFHLRPVSSQLEMARRCLQCGSKVQEKAGVIFGRPGVAEIT